MRPGHVGKALKDVSATAWREWFNGSVQQVFQADGFFDPEGIFIGDGSYLFVPDNPAYEGSVVMWFDEHNHPVDYEQLSPEQRKGAHRERCYKWVSLLHLRRGAYVYAGVALLCMIGTKSSAAPGASRLRFRHARERAGLSAHGGWR